MGSRHLALGGAALFWLFACGGPADAPASGGAEAARPARVSAAPKSCDADGDGVPEHDGCGGAVSIRGEGDWDCAPEDNGRAIRSVVDADGDGFPSATTPIVCGPPSPTVGFVPVKDVIGWDCDDTDGERYQLVLRDSDGDRYPDSGLAACVGDPLEAGWVRLGQRYSDDCAPEDATKYQTVMEDRDGDGASVFACGAFGPPPSWSNLDCNDADPSAHAERQEDRDGDGLASGYCGAAVASRRDDCDDTDSQLGTFEYGPAGADCGEVESECARPGAPREGWSPKSPQCSPTQSLLSWKVGDSPSCAASSDSCTPCLAASDCFETPKPTLPQSGCPGADVRLVVEERTSSCRSEPLITLENVGAAPASAVTITMESELGRQELEHVLGQPLAPGARSGPMFLSPSVPAMRGTRRTTLSVAASGCTPAQTVELVQGANCAL